MVPDHMQEAGSRAMSAMSFVVGRWFLGAAVIAALGCGPVAQATSLGTRAVDPAPAGSAPLLMGTMGETALAGRVLATDGTPLRAVSIVDGAARTQMTGAGIDERFTRATTVTGAATSSYLTDALGSAVALASSSFTVRTNDGYDPYGATSTSGTANTSPYPFTGRENDGTGLYFYRARYYNPIWGRFISEDPIGLAGGINRYAYAGNNPLSFKDPSGLIFFGMLNWSGGGSTTGSSSDSDRNQGPTSYPGPWDHPPGPDAAPSTATPSGLKINPAAGNPCTGGLIVCAEGGGSLRGAIKSAIEDEVGYSGTLGDVSRPKKMANQDPSLGNQQVRYYAKITDEFGVTSNYSVTMTRIQAYSVQSSFRRSNHNMKGEISFDCIFDEDEEFSDFEGCYRILDGDWHVFYVASSLSFPEKTNIEAKFGSGIKGVVIIKDGNFVLTKRKVKCLIADALLINSWQEVRGPDSLSLK